MARTARQDLDYFPMDVWFDQEDEIKLLESEFGNQATTLYMKLIARIYRENGYWKKWDIDKEMLFAKDINEPHNYTHEVISGCLRRGLFDKSVLEMFGVLTSRGIQKRYIDIVNQLGRSDVVIVREYWIYEKPLERFKRITPDFISISSDEKGKTSRGNDLKENENKRKENKIKQNNAREVNAFVGMELKQLPKLNTPLQADELEKLRAEFSDETVKDVLIAMENHKKLTKKYTSAYLTALNWCKRRNENHGQSESPVRTAGDREVDQLRNTHF